MQNKIQVRGTEMNTRKLQTVAIVTGLLAVPTILHAQVPAGTGFTYQGQLKMLGEPVDDTADFVVYLYDALAGGSQVGSSAPAYGVLVVDGLFTIELDFGAGVFEGDARWLEIAVRSPAGAGAFTTLSPRQPLNAAPYALYALSSPAGSEHWAASGDDICNTNAGNVGVGTTTPAHALHAVSDGERVVFGENTAVSGAAYGVYGQSASTGARAVTGMATALSGSAYGVFGQSSSSNGRGVYGNALATTGTAIGVVGQSFASDGRGVFGTARDTSGVNYGVYGKTSSANGYAGYFEGGRNYFQRSVGIGETDPQAMLHIGGTPDVDGIMFPDGTLQTTAAGAGLWTPDGDDIYYDTGNVGIGTSAPTARLHIEGTTEIGIQAHVIEGQYAVHGQNAYAFGSGVYGETTSSAGDTTGVYGKSASSGGRGVYGFATASTGTAYGVYGRASSSDGTGVYGRNTATTGEAIGVRGRTGSSDGYAGYFTGGRNYFEGNVGIGVTDPQTTLHLGGEDGVDGIIFPDGSMQTTAAVGGGGGSVWTQSASDIFYTAGFVGIGTSSPSERLHVAGDSQFDGAVGIGTTPSASSAVLDVESDSSYYVVNVTRTGGVTSGAAIQGSCSQTSGSANGVNGTTITPGGAGVLGTGIRAGVEGQALAGDGIGVIGHHVATAGDAPGIYGMTSSEADLASGVKGEATATSGQATIGVMGLSHSPLGIGVYGKSDTGAAAVGGYFVSESAAGKGVYATATDAAGWAGYFDGQGYFSGNVGIGTVTPVAELDVAGTARVDVLQIDGGADLSENFAIGGSAQPGMVVVIDSERPGALCTSTRAYDRRVAGIISGAGGVRTGMLMGQAGSLADGEHPVALTGRVYCWCDAAGGAIEPGDMLTTSDTPGHAMKVTDYQRAQGAIIGKAMTLLEEGQGLVLVLVNLQ
jgi:hypothetical protein